MSNQDWEKFGKDIQKTVQDAIDSKDFSRLNQTIAGTLDEAAEGFSKGMKTAQQSAEQAWQRYEQARQAREQQHHQMKEQQQHQAKVQYQQANAAYRMRKTFYRQTGGIEVGGIITTVLGGIIGVRCIGAIIKGLLSGSMTSAGVTNFITIMVVYLLILIISCGVFGRGLATLKRVSRFKRYNSIIGVREYCNICELAQKTGKSEKYIIKDVAKMIHKGWYRQGHMTMDKTCLIVSNRMHGQYQGLEMQRRQQLEEDKARKLAEEAEKNRKELQRRDLPQEVREVIEAGDAFVQKIRLCNDAIPGKEISAKISRMEKLVARIFDRVEHNPEMVSDIHRLMDYYLPTTVKLLEAYEELDAQPVGGENILSSKQEIEATIDTLNTAFEKLLDDLFQDTAWDVSSDISVLNTMLAREGLKKEGGLK